ncbi:MAG: hypothetical protein KDC38_00495 [Planctomycetes bacterium]|nr:hypothetical protein [Planctomycetota bacterium]
MQWTHRFVRLPSLRCPSFGFAVGVITALALGPVAHAQVSALDPALGAGRRPVIVGPPVDREAIDSNASLPDSIDPPTYGSFPAGGPSCPTSQFPPPDPDEDDTVFVADCGSGLDTGCTFRSGGPLVIQIPIDRYIGETNGDGTLAFPATLHSKNMVSLYAKIRLPAFDVDYSGGNPDCAPERDRISFNGHDLGFLTGADNIWKLNEFTVPIWWVKFPSAPGASGSKPAPAMNEIRIDIDTANSDECWCTAIDWVSVKIDAQAPIMLVHGVNADSSSWDDVADFLDGEMIIHSNNLAPIDNPPAGRIISNGAILSGKVPNIAKSVGAKKAHIVCHSKGGLDTRAYLSFFYDKDACEVLSQHTLSTPHHGSILATISVARLTYNDPTSDDERILKYMRQDGLASFLGQAPEQPALGNLSIAYMEGTFNRITSLPGGIRRYSFAADADVDGNLLISNAEAAGILPGALNFTLNSGSLLYHLLCCVEDITVTRMTNFFGLNEWHVIAPVWSGVIHLNDLAVTVQSAQYPGFSFQGTYDLNHGTIKSSGPMQAILNKIKADYPVKRIPD